MVTEHARNWTFLQVFGDWMGCFLVGVVSVSLWRSLSCVVVQPSRKFRVVHSVTSAALWPLKKLEMLIRVCEIALSSCVCVRLGCLALLRSCTPCWTTLRCRDTAWYCVVRHRVVPQRGTLCVHENGSGLWRTLGTPEVIDAVVPQVVGWCLSVIGALPTCWQRV